MKNFLRFKFYSWSMRLTHYFNFHYAPPIYPEGDTQLWCKWCGFRQTIARAGRTEAVIIAELNSKADKI